MPVGNGYALYKLSTTLARRRVSIVLAMLTGGTGPLQNRNSLGQDPCLIVSALESACRGGGEYFGHVEPNSLWGESSPSDFARSFFSVSQVYIVSRS